MNHKRIEQITNELEEHVATAQKISARGSLAHKKKAIEHLAGAIYSARIKLINELENDNDD